MHIMIHLEGFVKSKVRKRKTLLTDGMREQCNTRRPMTGQRGLHASDLVNRLNAVTAPILLDNSIPHRKRSWRNPTCHLSEEEEPGLLYPR